MYLNENPITPRAAAVQRSLLTWRPLRMNVNEARGLVEALVWDCDRPGKLFKNTKVPTRKCWHDMDILSLNGTLYKEPLQKIMKRVYRVNTSLEWHWALILDPDVPLGLSIIIIQWVEYHWNKWSVTVTYYGLRLDSAGNGDLRQHLLESTVGVGVKLYFMAPVFKA